MTAWRIVALVAVALGSLALRGCESYTAEYQTLPVLDWLDSRPPRSEAALVPPASDLARGLAVAMPLLVLAEDARPLSPVFGPPAQAQRMVSGVRDAAAISVNTPGTREHDRVSVGLNVLVFHRAGAAAAWVDLLSREMDLRDPSSGANQSRITGPDEADHVWIAIPGQAIPTGGVATLVGRRGPIAFQVQAAAERPGASDQRDMVDLAARAETIVRQAGMAWTAWLLAGASSG